MELKSPETPHPRETQHMPRAPHPKMRESRYFQPQPHPTMWLRWGPGCRRPATHEQSAPIVPNAQLLHVELAHNLQSPGIPCHTQV